MREEAHANRLVAAIAGSIAAWALLLAPAAIAAQPVRGALDPSFGHDGRIVSELGDSFGSSEFTSMLRQPDDKLLLVASFEAADGSIEGMIQRRSPSGTLDTTFGNDGTVITSRIQAIALQRDGGILVATNYSRDRCGGGATVRRLMPNGQEDRSFGTDGCATPLLLTINQMAVQPDGRIVLAGSTGFCPCGHVNLPMQLTLVRLQLDGGLDTTFGSGGKVSIRSEDKLDDTYATGLAVRDDGTILVAGSHSLLRLSVSGALDSSFGNDGVVEPLGEPRALLVMPGGEAVLASSSPPPCCRWPVRDFVLSRYQPDGKLNPGFGGDGRVRLEVGEVNEASALALAPDESIVLAGAEGGTGACRAGDCGFTPVLARFTASGALDPSFGQGGVTAPGIPGGTVGFEYNPRIAALAVAPGGQILAAGGAGGDSNAFVVAMNPNGQPEPGFGRAGSIEEIRTLPSSTQASGMAIGPNGRVLVSAWSNTGQHRSRTILLGLTSSGSFDDGVGSGTGFVVPGTEGELRADGHNRFYTVTTAYPGHGGAYVARFDDHGQRDLAYGTQGKADIPAHFKIESLVVRRSGAALVVGQIAHRFGMAAFALTPNGQPNRHFGRAGIAMVGFGPEVKAAALSATFDRRGRVVLFGNEGPYAGMARLLPDGRPDPNFAYNGRQPYMPALANEESAVALAPDGGILVAAAPEAGLHPLPTTLIRFRPDGIRDRAFGHNGLVRVDAGAPMVSFFGGHRLILVSAAGPFGEHGVAIRSFRADGSLDRRFGHVGVVTAATAHPLRPTAAARQPNGRIVLAGTKGGLDEPGTAIEVLRFR
jgi:uncharacterized delta-60 repeat protein